MSTAELKPDSPRVLVTAEGLLRDYAGQRCELIDGRVKFMSPPGFWHGSIEINIGMFLASHVREHGLGVVVSGDAGFVISTNPDTVLGPDVAFVRKDRIESIGPTEGYFPEAPALAVEVVSPDDTAEELDDKARRWLSAGTQMVWVLYPKNRTVTVYRSADDVKLVGSEGSLEGADVVPGFSVKVTELFIGLK